MVNESSSHWKVGIAFVLTCISIGSMIAVVNMTDEPDPEHDRFEISETEPLNINSWSSGKGTSASDEELSYQEQLRANGDADGRSKDYFTDDGETEFGGAVVGMAYDDFRDRLQFAGFEPIAVDSHDRCDNDAGFVECNYHYPETTDCMGTGEAYCSYTWRKGESEFLVTTRDGEGGEVIEMSYIR